MKPTSLTYTKRFNLGNYESEEISLTVDLDEGEKASEILPKLKALVNSQGSKGSLNGATNAAGLSARLESKH